MATSVTLQGRYVRLARKLAADRNRSFEENDEWDNTIHTFGVEAEERNFRGLMGEFAFAEYADLALDPETYEKSDGGGDFEVEYQGERSTIDVKTAAKEPYALFVKEGGVSADYYLQGYLEDQTVEFLGIASCEQVRASVLKETPRNHRNYEVAIKDLDPIPAAEKLKPVG